MMSRTRTIARVAVGVALTGALAAVSVGCTPSAGDEKVTSLTLLANNNSWTEGVKTLAKEYEEETGIKVVVQGFSPEQINDTLKVKLNAQSSDFDLMGFHVQDFLTQFTQNGWLADLTDYVESDPEWDWEDIQEPARESVQVDDRIYGIPVMTERHIVYYRSDVLADAGIAVPATLDELEAAAAKLNDPENGFYGIAMRGARVPLVTQFSSFLYSFGGDFQDEDGNATVDTPEAIEAYEFYGNLLRNYGPPGATNMGWVEASAIFAQGNAAFYVDADSQAYTFLDPTKSAVVDTVAYASFPAGPDGARPYNIVPQTVGINEFSKKKDAAWDFLKWVTNKENTKQLLAEETVSVARQSAWDDPEAAGAYPQGLLDVIRNLSPDAVGHDRPQLEQIARAREIVGGPAVVAIEGGDVATAAKQANDEFQDLLDSEK
jgi:multiple sugar transport system substrate-binding protein